MLTSLYPDVDIPNVSVYDYLFDRLTAEELGRTALFDPATGSETTYGELKAQIDDLAGSLAARGVGPGLGEGQQSVLGLLCPNTPEFAVVFHGILRAGATVTTINSLYTSTEIEKQLRDAGASWIFTVNALLPQAAIAATAVGISEDRVIVMDEAPGHLSIQDLLDEHLPAPAISINPDTHVAVLPYSSGTTGNPKGVMLSHRNLVANVQQCRPIIDLHADDRVLAVLPFFHIYGLTVLLNLALRQRASLVLMKRFALDTFLDNVEIYRCTYVFIAPPIAVALAKSPLVAERDITTVRTVFSGAAPLDGETADVVARRLHSRVIQGYGMSELSPISHATPTDRHGIPVSSIGVVLPNMQAKLVDIDTGLEIEELDDDGASRPGELWVRGPNVMLGYLNQPEATAAAIDAEGYLHTGDIATYHKGGYFTIVDRLKELIKYKGYQIAPAELEALLLGHPSILDAAVIGVLDEDRQEIPKAFVVTAPDSHLDADDVMTFVSQNVAPYKKVRRVEFIDTIPKSTSGKILRKDLRARERANVLPQLGAEREKQES